MTDQPSSETSSRLVYIREVAVVDLPEEVQDQAEGLETLFAIGAENGDRLALVHDRETAFVVALQNDMHPMSVH
jgi:hypothetical protein